MPDPIAKPGGKKIAGIDRKWWLLGGGGAAIIVFFVYRRQKAAAAAAAVPTDPNAIDPNDPNAGMPYGTSGFGSTAGGTASSYGYLDQATGQFIGLGGQGVQSTGVLAPPTNAAWAQQASALMTQHGWDELTVDAAIGKYLAGLALTSDQYNIITTVIGLEGLPPNPPVAPHVVGPPPGQVGGGTPVTHHATYAVQLHQISVKTSARALVQRFSSPSANQNSIETALRLTVTDPRNARYLPAYVGTGTYPAKAAVYLHVVTAA
jgi:hypothetical protein